MVKTLADLIGGKRVLLLGFGMEGRSTYSMIRETGAFSRLDIADLSPQGDFPDCDAVFTGADYLDHIDEYDVAFRSPGIVLPRRREEYKCKITSQAEVFLHRFNRQVIGVTGTAGKSTVSSLLFHVLSTDGVPCLLAGNIGTPVFEIAKEVAPETVVILELSCHQLEMCATSPALSVLLNVYEEHLDHYGTFENYKNAKKNIFLHQHPLDVLYCDAGAAPSRTESHGRTIVVNPDILPFESLETLPGVRLRGRHNLSNCAFVYSIARSFGIADAAFVSSLQSYSPLPHRLEFVGSKNGVDYYDDSISTAAQSTINAVDCVKNAATLLVGGMDRGIDYTSLVDYLSGSGLSHVICMYQSGGRIYEMMRGKGQVNPEVLCCRDLYEAAGTAQRVTAAGGACLLSPASASYGAFRNFEERGDVFRRLIFGVAPRDTR